MKSNITKREKLMYTAMISCIIAIFMLCIITDVYARYSSTLYGYGDMEIAKWSFKVNNSSEGEEFALNIETDNNKKKITPGATGKMYLTVENESDVNAKYTISLSEKFMNTSEISESIQCYLDSSYSEESKVDIDKYDIVGKLDTNENKIKKITIYWKWIENTQIDQVIAENYDGFTFDVKVVGEETTLDESEDFKYTKIIK